MSKQRGGLSAARCGAALILAAALAGCSTPEKTTVTQTTRTTAPAAPPADALNTTAQPGAAKAPAPAPADPAPAPATSLDSPPQEAESAATGPAATGPVATEPAATSPANSPAKVPEPAPQPASEAGAEAPAPAPDAVSNRSAPAPATPEPEQPSAAATTEVLDDPVDYYAQEGAELDPQNVHFSSCDEARGRGYSYMREGEPGYDRALDPDGDGLACDQ
ncbi:excalibur calcium-binding domain-containing protein [Deinococcus lacus]|uniref:Excalibur calcium-binding domain-containing protein n=1 Tax=Deinococcus lacus TaxID=392561 RepID=A0ABW1YEJ3_9DEIO